MVIPSFHSFSKSKSFLFRILLISSIMAGFSKELIHLIISFFSAAKFITDKYLVTNITIILDINYCFRIKYLNSLIQLIFFLLSSFTEQEKCLNYHFQFFTKVIR